MLTHKAFGNVLFKEMWRNPWTGERWGAFETYDGFHVNLPLSEVKVLA